MSVPSYMHGASDQPMIGDTIGVHFDRTVARCADRPALIVRQQGIHWTWAELARHVDAFAAGLVALGLQPGDRVGIWSPNNAEWIITQYATAKAGLILVNINPAYRVTELEYALNKVGSRALITMPSFKTSDYIGMLRELAPELDRASPVEWDKQIGLNCTGCGPLTAGRPTAVPMARQRSERPKPRRKQISPSSRAMA